MGASKKAPFDIAETIALDLLGSPNPHRRPNSDVVRPWCNGIDLTQRSRSMWIIDFGNDRSFDDAAFYAAPFEYAEKVVKPAEPDGEKRV